MQKVALSPRDSLLMQKFITGGLAVGGGVSAGAALVNYLKHLSDKTRKEENEKDDDTFYVDIPASPEKQAAAPDASASWFGPGVAMASGGLASLASFALVQKLYKKLKKKQMQEDLDEAQRMYFKSYAGPETPEKVAAAPDPSQLRLWDVVTGGPVAASMLTALAGGVLTYKMMDKTFPRLKTPKAVGPKRVKIRRFDPSTGEVVEDQKEKVAGVEDDSAGVHLLLKLAMASDGSRDGYLHDLVGAVASGRYGELVALCKEAGAIAALESTKGYADSGTEAQRAVAVALLTKSAAFSDVVGLLAAAEFADSYPVFTKMAASLDAEDSEILEGVGGLLGTTDRAQSISEILGQSLEEDPQAPQLSVEDALAAILGQEAQPQDAEQDGMIDKLNRNDTVAGSAVSNSTDREDAQDDLGTTPPKDDVDRLISGTQDGDISNEDQQDPKGKA